MPEGPEIWRSADKLNAALAGRTVHECFFYHDNLKPYEDDLKGAVVERVEPRAKALLTFFNNGLCMYSHNQLYGKWYTAPAGSLPDTDRSLRVALHNREHSALLYSASEIELLPAGQLQSHPYLQKLGPDVVNPRTTVEQIMGQYREDGFQNRKLATLLLDQNFLSGVGNYLRSEILFYAGVNPTLKLRECDNQMKQELAEASRTLSRRSYKTGGITNDAKIVAALKRENAGRSTYRHFVYGRTGDFCHKCGTEIREEKTGGRKIYYCPSCQNYS